MKISTLWSPGNACQHGLRMVQRLGSRKARDTMPDSLPDPAATAALAAERVLILDFGSQVTQLIARRLREADPSAPA